MKRIKRTMAVLLAILMVMSAMPLTAMSETKTDANGDFSNGYWYYTAATDTLYIDGYDEGTTLKSCDDRLTNVVEHYLPTVYTDESGIVRLWNEAFSHLVIGAHISSLGEIILGYDKYTGFYNYPDVTSVEFEKGSTLSTLGAYQLYKLPIKSIELPDTLTSIGTFCFANSNLEEITVPSSVTSIDEYAFYNCKRLKTAVINASIKTVENYLFANDSSLKNVTLPDSLTAINPYAFNECKLLNKIDIPNGVVSIGTKAFNEASLNNIILPDSMETIGEYAFRLNNLGEIVIPESVSIISKGAFNNAGITSLEFKEGVEKIYSYAFSDNDMTELVTPESLAFVDAYAFMNNYKLLHADLSKSKITVLNDSVFKNCSALESLNAPSVKTVNAYALNKTTSLKEVNMPKLRGVNNYAFQGSGIESIEFAERTEDDTAPFIGIHAFDSCANLSSVKLPNDLYTVGQYAFYKCLSLRSISLPKHVATIAEGAFAYSSVNSIKIPNKDAYIADDSLIIGKNTYDSDLVIKGYSGSTAETFASEHSIKFELIDPDSEDTEEPVPDLTEEQIAANSLKGTWSNGTWQVSGNTLTIYGEGEMNNNIAVDYNGKVQTFGELVREKETTRIIINNGVTSIPDKFMYIDEDTRVESLNRVCLADSISSIGDYAFANTNVNFVTNEYLYNLLKYSGSGFNCQYFPSNITHIGKYAFANCSCLYDKVILPLDLTEICEGAFYNTNITYVFAFGKIQSIGKKAFTNCKQLTYLEVPYSVNDIYSDSAAPENNAFGYNDDGTVNSNLIVYCRSTSKAQEYASSNGIKTSEYYGTEYADGVITYTYKKNYATTYNYKLHWYYYAEDDSIRVVPTEDSESGYVLINKVYNYGTKLSATSADEQVTLTQYVPSLIDMIENGNITKRTETDFDIGSMNISNLIIEDGITEFSVSDLLAKFNPEYVELPSTLTALNYRVFEGCDRLKSVSIPNGVKSLDADAFKGCEALQGVDLGNGITAVHDSMFENCNKLQIVGIGSSVKSIGERAFYNCTALEQIMIPDSVETIGSKAFHNTIKAQSITLGSGVSSIGEGAFTNSVYCDNININSNITAENTASAFKDVGSYTDGVRLSYGVSVTSADFKPFDGIKISEISLGANVSSVTNTQYLPYVRAIEVSNDNSNFYLYNNCLYSRSDILVYAPATLKEISIKEGATKIGDYACYGTNAVNIEIPSSVTEIGNYAFAQSRTLNHIDILKGTVVIGEGAFEDCILLKKFYAPSTLTSIGRAAFKGCINLAGVIPSTKLAVIGEEAFMGCTSLVGIVFDENVESIGDRAFKDCINFEEIYLWYNTQLGADVFQNDNKLTIYTVAGSDAYRYAREYGVTYSAYTDDDLFYDLCGEKLDVLAGYLGYCTNGHGNTEYLTVYEADCENDGYIIGVCEYCSEILEEIHVDASGHNYKLTTQIPATATVRGMKVYTCINCGQSFCEYTEPTGEDVDIQTHTVAGTVVIATGKKATEGKAPAKNVSVVIDGMVVATTDSEGKFSLKLETGSYEAELRYAYGFTRTIFIVVEDEDIVLDNAIPIIGCDFNKDGKIDNKDLELFQMVVSSKENDPSYLEFVDMNNDGYINAKDRMYIISCNGIDTSTFKYEDIVIQK